MAATVQELSLLLRLRDEASRGVQNFQQGLNSLTRSLEHSHQRMYRMGGTFNNLVTAGGRFMHTGRMIGETWRRGIESMSEYTDATMRLYQAQQKFQSINLSLADNARAFGAVQNVVKDMQGLTLTDTTEMITDLHTALGNLDEAIVALPTAGKFRFAFQTLFGDKFTGEQIEQNLQSGFKFLEMIGAMRATGAMGAGGKREFSKQDEERMEQFFSRQAQMMAATGGRVTPQAMLAMARTGGTALQGLSQKGLMNLSAPLQELGGPRTGTALQAVFQAVVGGVIPKHLLGNWENLGMLRKKDAQGHAMIEYTKAGIPSKTKPGAIMHSELLQEDPLAFFDKLREAMAKRGIDVNDPKTITKELTGLFGRATARELTSLFINQRDRIIKEAALAAGAKDIPELYNQAFETPMGKMKRFEAAVENFKTEVGRPMLELGTSIATGMMPVLAFFSEHPQITKFVALAVPAIMVLTTALETLFLLKATGAGSIITFFTQWGSAAKLAAVETRAAAAAAAAAGVVPGGGGFIGPPRASQGPFLPAIQQVSKLRSAMSAIAPVLTTTVVLAGVGIAVTQLIDLKRQYDDWDREYGEGKKKARAEYDAAVMTGKAFTPVKGYPAQVDEEIDRAIERLNAAGELTKAFEPKVGLETFQRVFGMGAALPNPYGQYFTPKGGFIDPKRFAPERAAPIFAEMMPGIIGNVSKMAALISRAQAGTLPGVPLEAREQIFETLKLADPATYEAAVASLAVTTKEAETSMFAVVAPAGDLASQLGNASAAASRFSVSVGTLQMPGMLGAMGPLGVMAPRGVPGPAVPGASIFAPKKAGLGISMLPGAAAGAIVEKTGVVNVHGGERIEPARLAKFKERSAPAVNVNYSPTIHASGDPEQFERQLAAHSRVVAELVHDELAGFMERT